MLFQLMPCLLSKREHCLIATEVKVLGKLRRKLHEEEVSNKSLAALQLGIGKQMIQ